jgi:hypothetical protein
MNKSMPIEKIRLDPFDDTPPPVKKPAKSKKELTSRYEPKRIQRAVKDDRTELDYINTALATKTDVDYIRSSSLLPQVTQPRKPNTPNEPLFQPARKYFVPSLSLRKD